MHGEFAVEPDRLARVQYVDEAVRVDRRLRVGCNRQSFSTYLGRTRSNTTLSAVPDCARSFCATVDTTIAFTMANRTRPTDLGRSTDTITNDQTHTSYLLSVYLSVARPIAGFSIVSLGHGFFFNLFRLARTVVLQNSNEVRKSKLMSPLLTYYTDLLSTQPHVGLTMPSCSNHFVSTLVMNHNLYFDLTHSDAIRHDAMRCDTRRRH